MTIAILAGVAAIVIVAVIVVVAAVRGSGSPTIAKGLGTIAPATGAPATPSAAPLIVYIGNSFVGGSDEDSGANDRFPALVSAGLSVAGIPSTWRTITADSSGYVTQGEGGLDFENLADKVPTDAAVVVIMGSDDDAAFPEDRIMDAALDTLQLIRQRAPNAKVLVVSTPWVSADPPAGILSARDAVQQAARFDNLPSVDPIADGWLVTGPPEQVGDDGLHPTDLGHAQMAEHLQPVIAGLLPSQ